MEIEVRSSVEIDPVFERAWNARLALAPHANFSLSCDYLRHQAAAGESARLVLADEGPFRAALVLRESAGELACGFPWRPQAVVEGADPGRPEGMTPGEAQRLFRVAERVAGRNRLRFFSTHPAGGSLGGYLAGCTVMVDLRNRSEDELFAAMDTDKRRCVKKARREGFEVCAAPDLTQLRQFAHILDDLHARRHGSASPVPAAETPGPGEGWRTWEHPWHWLLCAIRDGRVEAGLGWGRRRGGSLEGRVIAATESARRLGVTGLLGWEGMRLGRCAGHTWANHGGDTHFKREFGGVVMPIHGRLGGGPEWLAPNLVETLVRGEARRAARSVLSRCGALRRPARAGRP